MSIVTQGQITLLDLIDSATYIYYAKDLTGMGATLSPDQDHKFIGFYNGQAIKDGQPNPEIDIESYNQIKEQIQWFRYYGDKGDPGEKGNGIVNTKIEYGISASQKDKPSEWFIETEKPWTTIEKPYLWTKVTLIYQNGDQSESYSISESGGNVKYTILSNTDQVSRFYDKQEEQQKFLQKKDSFGTFDKTISFSPGTLRFKILEKKITEQGKEIESEWDDTYFKKGCFSFSLSSENKILELFPESLEPIIVGKSQALQADLKFSINPYIEKEVLKDRENFYFAFNIDSFISEYDPNNLSQEQLAQEEVAKKVAFRKMIFEDSCFSFEILNNTKTQKIASKKILNFLGMTDSLAKFNINASNITAAVENSKIKFDARGLHILNSGFDITNNALEKVLFADSEGNLHIKGQLEGASGIFRGKLEAASGSFDGNVTCSSGRIGGFEINEDSFQSIQKRGDGITSTLVLDGQNGFIEAERSILHSLELKKQIDIGDTICIKTPTNDEEAFLSVRDQNGIPVLSAKKKGTIQIGSDKNHVLLDGGNSCIYAGESPMNYNWKISPEEAIFNNIVAKGSIKASVFEYGSVQSLGGILVVRPSTQVKKIKDLPIDDINYKKVIYVNSCNGFNVGDWCIFQTEQQGLFQEVYQITEIDPQNNCITFNEQLNQFISNMPLINLGKNGSIGIGLNATGDSSFIPRNAMSVFSFSFTDSNHYRLSPKIILGEMTGENGENTFGLYAEGVKLKGSLITDTSNGKNEYGYAGINTSGQEVPFSSLYADKFNNEPSPILIWAGATGSSKEEIEKANFFVDRNGNLYANSGFFNGTIITNSSIVASEIKTATIIGDNKKTDQPALTIKDTKKGILFTNENGEKILEVTDDNITMRASSINFNDHFVITEKGMPLLSHLYIGQNIKGSSSLGIKDNKIICIPKDENNIIGNSEAGYISIKDTIDFSANGSKKDLSITNNLIEVCSNINFNEKILYYNKQTYFNPVYNKENNFVGYDFYITEKEQ